MVEKVVIEVSAKENLDNLIDHLVEVGVLDKKNAEQFKKHSDEFKKNQKETQKALKDTESTASSVTKNIGNQFKNLGSVIAGAFAVQSVIQFGKASINAAIEAERGNKLLFNALNKNQAAFDRLTKSAAEYQKTTVYDDDSIIAAQTFLATQGRTEEQINKVIRAATNLSAVTGESLQSSVEKLDATYEGSIGRLGKMDSNFKKLTQAQLENGAAIDLVAEKYKGFAEAELETTSGKIKALQNQFGELQEELGNSILIGAAPIFKDIANEISNTNTEISELARKFGMASDEAERFNVITFLTKNIVKALSEPFRALNWIIEKNAEGFNWLADKLGIAEKKTKSIADLVAENQKYIDEQAKKSIEATTEENKLTETQIRNIAYLTAEKKRLSDELEKNSKTVEENKADYAALVDIQKELDAILGKTTEKIKEQKKAMEDLPTEMWEQMAEGQRQAAQKRIDEEKKTADEIADYKMQSDKDVADYEAELMAEHRREIKADTDFEIAEAERAKAAAIQTEQDKADAKKLIIQRSIEATMQLINMALQYQLQINQQETDAALNNLEIRLQKEQITQEQYEKERRTLLREQAKKQKEYAIIQATIETANAVIKAYSDGGPFAGPALAAIAGAVGLAQIAVISATPLPEFEKGGRVKGKRHRDGGTIIEAEEGEYVINRKAAKKIGFDSLNALNKGILPPKMLKQALSEQKNKSFENRLITVLGSSGDFDTYPLERLMKKGIKQERELTETLVKVIKGTSRKRGGY